MFPRFTAPLLALASLASFSFGQLTVNLSDYLHAAAGQSDCDSNPPFMESINCVSYGFGHNCPGNFASNLIRFSDTTSFAHGIGMHPQLTGLKTLRFDLDAIRDATGREPVAFQARVGIDIPSGGGANGATFFTTLDDVLVNTTLIADGSVLSVQLNIPVTGVRFLQLSTERVGVFNGNHACFADAKVVLGPPCPHPVLGHQPRSADACVHSTVTFDTIGAYWGLFSYHWRKNGVPINAAINESAASATLILPSVTDADNGTYDCVVTNGCGDTISNPATLHICASDFNCDGITDFFDYLDFVSVFASGDLSGDYNQDGVVDFFDYLDFVQTFSGGCP